MGKPAIVIGNGYFWRGMPGLFEINDQKTGVEAIKQILDGYIINRDDVKIYFYAIQESRIPYDYVMGFDEQGGRINQEKFEMTRQAFIPIIKEFCNVVRTGMNPLEQQLEVIKP